MGDNTTEDPLPEEQVSPDQPVTDPVSPVTKTIPDVIGVPSGQTDAIEPICADPEQKIEVPATSETPEIPDSVVEQEPEKNDVQPQRPLSSAGNQNETASSSAAERPKSVASEKASAASSPTSKERPASSTEKDPEVQKSGRADEEAETKAGQDAGESAALLGDSQAKGAAKETGPTVIDMGNSGETAAQAEEPKASTSERPSTRERLRQVYQCMKGNEIFVLLLGSLTFFVGCIFLAVGAYMMQSNGKCPQVSSQGNDSSQANGYGENFLVYHGIISGMNGTGHHEGNETEEHHGLVNLAAGRPAYQSSTYRDLDQTYPADRAVDGLTTYRFDGGACARTELEAMPFWYVDLEKPYMVHAVHIFLPTDCCVGDMHNFEVRVGQESEELKLNSMCRYHMGTTLQSSVQLNCERPVYGRYVSIQMLGDQTRPKNRLTLCEVHVHD